MFFFFMRRRPPRSKRSYTLFPYTTLSRSTWQKRGKGGLQYLRWEAWLRTRFWPTGRRQKTCQRGKTSTRRPARHASHRHTAKRHRRPRRHKDRPRTYGRSEEHTSELQSLMRSSYAVFCLKKKTTNNN